MRIDLLQSGDMLKQVKLHSKIGSVIKSCNYLKIINIFDNGGELCHFYNKFIGTHDKYGNNSFILDYEK